MRIKLNEETISNFINPLVGKLTATNLNAAAIFLRYAYTYVKVGVSRIVFT